MSSEKDSGDTCRRCGGPILYDTERRWGLCTCCLMNPEVPLPVATESDTGVPENAGTYRSRPLRWCPGCKKVTLQPRRRLCDKCCEQRKREATRQRVRKHRSKRHQARQTERHLM